MTPNQDGRGGCKSVSRAYVPQRAPVKILRPEVTLGLRNFFPLLPKLFSALEKKIFPALFGSSFKHEKSGKHCSWGTPHELPRRVTDVPFNEIEKLFLYLPARR